MLRVFLFRRRGTKRLNIYFIVENRSSVANIIALTPKLYKDYQHWNYQHQCQSKDYRHHHRRHHQHYHHAKFANRIAVVFQGMFLSILLLVRMCGLPEHIGSGFMLLLTMLSQHKNCWQKNCHEEKFFGWVEVCSENYPTQTLLTQRQ